jgi:microcystin-dependent protein
MPSHTHEVMAVTADAQSPSPSGRLPAHAEEETYAAPQNLTALAAGSVGATGGNQAHENMQPFLVVNFCIALRAYPAAHGCIYGSQPG